MPSQQQLHWINEVGAPAAVASEKETQLPAALTLAQACLESNYGTQAPGNNCFGIKADAHGSGVQYLQTKEVVAGAWETEDLGFETYLSIADCFVDHARLITSGSAYAVPWKAYLDGGTVDALISGIAGIYATAPAYALLVQEIAHEPAVAAALARARGAL